MMTKLYDRVMELKLTDEEKADMLAEMVIESNRIEGKVFDNEEGKEKYLWRCMWGARVKGARLNYPIDRPTTYGSDEGRPGTDKAWLFFEWNEEVSGSRRDVEENMDLWDAWEVIGRSVRDIVDVKILEGLLEGKGQKEIAESMGMSVVGVWKRVVAIKKKVKHALTS